MENSRLILLSSSDPQETAVGELVQLRLGGSLARVDAQRKTLGLREPDVARFRPDQLEQLYCKLATATTPCTVVVWARAVPETIAFLEQHPGTINDFAPVVCTTTQDAASQQSVTDRLARLSHMGADHSRLSGVFAQAPRAVPVEEAFAQLVAHVVSGNYRGVSVDAALYQSAVFTRVRDLQLPVGAMLRGEVDYQISLRLAHWDREPEHVLRQFARQLMVQRALAGCKAEIARALNALRVPDLSGRDRSASMQEEEISPPQQPAAPADEIMCEQAAPNGS